MAANSSQTPQPGSRRTLKTAGMVLLSVIAAVGAFALAFLISHHGAPKPAPAKVVNATIKPGPHAATLKKAFVSASIKPLIKPKPKPKPKTTTTTATPTPVEPAASEEPAAPVESEPAPTYTPPAAPAPTPTKTPAKKKAPSGGGVITIG
jgi:outer membrane biosynthesis protein TonB